MTPIKWVQKYDLRDGPQPIETGPVTFIPVLTLTDLEAWLKEQKQFYRYKASQGFDVLQSCETLTDLLAQVRAWRGGGK
jgi:hypothetical protein